jgi:hypothetical protein
MSKTILITDFDTPLGNILVETAVRSGYQVISTRNPAFPDPTEKKPTKKGRTKKSAKLNEPLKKENPFILPWNRRSPISARSIIMKSLHSFNSIDHTLLLYTPLGETRPIHDLPGVSISDFIDSTIKGNLFLLKEILFHSQKNNQATLSLVINTEGSEIFSPLDAVTHGAFESLAKSMFEFYQNESIAINGFKSESPNVQEFSDFILKTMEEKAAKNFGKWFRYSKRTSLFNLKK